MKEQLSILSLLNFLDALIAGDYGEGEWDELTETTKQDQREYILHYCRVPQLSVATAGNWLKYLGLKFKKYEKSYYTDLHEHIEQLLARAMFSFSITFQDNLESINGHY